MNLMKLVLETPPRLRVRLTWFALIWTCSVLALALVAGAIKLLLR